MFLVGSVDKFVYFVWWFVIVIVCCGCCLVQLGGFAAGVCWLFWILPAYCGGLFGMVVIRTVC